jgi:hypothetical protein
MCDNLSLWCFCLNSFIGCNLCGTEMLFSRTILTSPQFSRSFLLIFLVGKWKISRVERGPRAYAGTAKSVVKCVNEACNQHAKSDNACAQLSWGGGERERERGSREKRNLCFGMCWQWDMLLQELIKGIDFKKKAERPHVTQRNAAP